MGADVRYLALVLAAACAVTAGPAFAETNPLTRKAQPNTSMRVTQYSCLEGMHQCCCDKAGPLCCPGYTCIDNGRIGYCLPDK